MKKRYSAPNADLLLMYSTAPTCDDISNPDVYDDDDSRDTDVEW